MTLYYSTFRQVSDALGCPLALSAMVHLTVWRDWDGADTKEKYVRRVFAEFGYAGLVVAGLVEATVKGSLGLVFLVGAGAGSLLSSNLYNRCRELTIQSCTGTLKSFIATLFSTYLLVTNPFLTTPCPIDELPALLTIRKDDDSFKKCSSSIHRSLSFSAMAHLTFWRNKGGNDERYIRKISAEFGYAGLVVAGLVEAVVKGVLTIVFIVGTQCPGFLFPELQSASQKLAQKSFKSTVDSIMTAVASLYFLGANLRYPRLT